jgi:hypothetical protein
MEPSRHQDWSDFRDLVDSGNPALVVVPGSPRAVFFTEAGGARASTVSNRAYCDLCQSIRRA